MTFNAKIKMAIVMLFITLPIYSDAYIFGSLSDDITNVNASSSVEFSYNPTTTDVFEIGFSKNPVTDLSTVVQASDEYNTMSIVPGTFKGFLSDIFIY